MRFCSEVGRSRIRARRILVAALAVNVIWRDVISEIERYFVNPGQATAYKVGMHKLLGLREHAQSVLGDEFDLRQFHDVVLDNGSMPLTVLERLVEDSLQTGAGSNPYRKRREGKTEP